MSPVLFHEALQLVPKNAVTIEVAPHTLMQSIIKMSVGSECTYVGLMKKNEPDEIKYFLSSLGRLVIYYSGSPLICNISLSSS